MGCSISFSCFFLLAGSLILFMGWVTYKMPHNLASGELGLAESFNRHFFQSTMFATLVPYKHVFE